MEKLAAGEILAQSEGAVIHVRPALHIRVGRRQYVGRPVVPCRSFASLYGKCESGIATVFTLHEDQIIDADTLRTWKVEILDVDDVFQNDFLQTIIFAISNRKLKISLTQDAESLIRFHWGTSFFAIDIGRDGPSGPYAFDAGELFEVSKVYPDSNLAFVQAIRPKAQNDGTFEKVSTPASDLRGLGVAVPARTYSHGRLSGDKPSPLSVKGMRIAVKDNYAIAGTQTSLCSRAYHQTQFPQVRNAKVVSKLLEAGASIVGKTHMASFALMEHPTQSVDFQAPFNPRGDGYLVTGGSSSGSAVAVASYDWVDIALCTDTSGSARVPAYKTGVFGFRSSTTAVSKNGVVESWSDFDATGWVGRDLALFPAVCSAIRNKAEERSLAPRKPRRILCMTDRLDKTKAQIALINDFLGDLDHVLGFKHHSFDVVGDWCRNGPVPERNLNDYLHNMTKHGIWHAAYSSFAGFREAYQKDYGRPPFVTEVVRWVWDVGKDVTEEQHAETKHRLEVFRKWFGDHYMSDPRYETVIMYQLDVVEPEYRDVYPGNDNPLSYGFRPSCLAPILQAPELAIPIGQTPYQSRISEREEQLPMSISLMGAPGTDKEFLEWTVDTMEKAGRATKVQTGTTAFPLANR